MLSPVVTVQRRFAGIIQNGVRLLISHTNITALTVKWHIPLLFFRAARENVSLVRAFYPDNEVNHLQGSIIPKFSSAYALRCPLHSGLIVNFAAVFSSMDDLFCIGWDLKSNITRCLS